MKSREKEPMLKGINMNMLFRLLSRSRCIRSGSMTQNRRNTKSAAARRGVYIADESRVHARVYNVLKARRSVGGGGEYKVLSSLASATNPPFVARENGESSEKESRNEGRERGREGSGGALYLYTYFGCISGGAWIPEPVSGDPQLREK